MMCGPKSVPENLPAQERRRARRFPDGPSRLLAELPASDSGSQSENVGRVLEDSPLKHFRRANEAVGSTTTVIQQHLTSFASRAVNFGASIHSARCLSVPAEGRFRRSGLALLRLIKRLLKKPDGRYLILYSRKA
jgi:hypothetical protein